MPSRAGSAAGIVVFVGDGTEAILVGLGMVLIFGFGAAIGLSFELSPEEEKRKDYHWARVKGFRWSGLAFKWVGVPVGAVILLIGVAASIAGLLE